MGSVVPFPASRKLRTRRDRRREAVPGPAQVVILPAIRISRSVPPPAPAPATSSVAAAPPKA
ncbi:hypothetical protein [Ancylobacter oerskovii]|uniref:Uncharacterized protein n=1 Tax=Ancylobacter oerskovii TaxID=459519 RepID=A0ABW4YXF2_9HYPH|nr:hypothetical protein [Ancylobacter oerskovii]MBS7542030.1 hypothetical protein [Ancylobacter oerskovii]